MMIIKILGNQFEVYTDTSRNQILIVSLISIVLLSFYGMSLGYGSDFVDRAFIFISGLVTGQASAAIKTKKVEKS